MMRSNRISQIVWRIRRAGPECENDPCYVVFRLLWPLEAPEDGLHGLVPVADRGQPFRSPFGSPILAEPEQMRDMPAHRLQDVQAVVNEGFDAELRAVVGLLPALQAEDDAVTAQSGLLVESVMFQPVPRAVLDARTALRDQPDAVPEYLYEATDGVESTLNRRRAQGVLQGAAE